MYSNLELDIMEYARAYYSGEALISDEKFDHLIDLLKIENPDSIILNSVGWGYTPTRNKTKHLYSKITGLPKYKEINDIPKGRGIVYTITPKLDGISCVLYYKDGELDKAVTRGDGEVGMDITHYVKYLVPTKLNYPYTTAIRGELCMTTAECSKLELVKSARNWISGVINSTSATLSELSHIKFIPYSLIEIDDKVDTYNHNIQSIKLFSTLGDFIEIPVYYMSSSQLDYTALKNLYDEYSTDYIIDGLVLYDEILASIDFEVPHSYSVSPKTHFAFKFASETAQAKVIGIEWNLTSSGKYSPVLLTTPILLNGATIKRVSAYNYQYVVDNQLGEGSSIEIERSGDIIPVVKSVLSPRAYIMTDQDKKCPYCLHTLTQKGPDLICDNPECAGKLRFRLRQLAQYIKVDGVSLDAITDDLEDSYEHSTYKDTVYWFGALTDSINHNSVKYQNYTLIYEKLKSNKYTSSDILTIANIPGISTKTISKIPIDLINRYVTDSDFHNWSEFSQIHGIGSCLVISLKHHHSLVHSIYRWIGEEYYDNSEYSTDPIDTIKVAVTGKLSVSRSKFSAYLSEYNYEIISNVSKAKYLICNQKSSSSKYKQAIMHNIPIVTEEEFKYYENLE